MSYDSVPVIRLSTFLRTRELCRDLGWSTPMQPGCEIEVIDPPENADDVQRCIVACGLASVGVQMGDPRTRKEFLRLVGPAPHGARWDLDRAFRLHPPQGMSTCMAIVLGWARDNALWSAGYTYGQGTSWFEAHARRVKAWASPTSLARPSAGCFVVFGEGDLAHASLCVSLAEGELFTVDGGQVGALGLQAIFAKRRSFKQVGITQTIDGRPVYGWVDPALLPRSIGMKCRVPVGWREIPL